MSGVFLINPGINAKKNLGFTKRFAVKVPPLGLAYMGAKLLNNGEEVFLIDQFAEEIDDNDLIAKVLAVEPELVAITLLTASASRTKKICLTLKKYLNPRQKIVLGNIHAAIFYQSILEEGWADIIVRGEGEYILPEILQALRLNLGLNHIEGISFFEEGKVITNTPANQIKELDCLPFPAWELYNLDKYQTNTILSYGKKILPVITSRGCPWRCPFCSQNHFWDNTYLRDPVLVAEEIKINITKFGVHHFTFHDANFPTTKEYGLKICKEIKRLGLQQKMTFVTEARIEVFDEELIAELASAGCCALMFGIESGSERVRATVKKNFSNKQIAKVVNYCTKYKLHTMGLFLIGLPGETRSDVIETIKFSQSLPLHLAKYNIVVPYPGSALFNQLPNKDKMNVDDFDRIATFYADKFSALTVNEFMDHHELDLLQKKALISFYLRPQAVWRLIKNGPISITDIGVGGLSLLLSGTRFIKKHFQQ
ncbi:MAG: radical SAM protein [Oligoflexia bacterium]|nr:radical SAM protein [Oligoflexia bacterium]